MINNILGGMIGATIDEAKVKAEENSRVYPSFSISGTITLLIIAAWALAEPKIEAKKHISNNRYICQPPSKMTN